MPSKFHEAHEARKTFHLKIKRLQYVFRDIYFMGQEDKFNQNETSFGGDKARLIESEAPELTRQFIFRAGHRSGWFKTHLNSDADLQSSTRLQYTLHLSAARYFVLGQTSRLSVLWGPDAPVKSQFLAICFPDQAKFLIFASNQARWPPFPYSMLSALLAQQETAGGRLSPLSSYPGHHSSQQSLSSWAD